VPYALKFGNNPSGSEYQVDIPLASHSYTGTYTISARAWATSDYNGNTQLLHSRFYTSSGGEIGTTGGGFPTSRDQWEDISVTFSATSAPYNVSWYVGYPQRNSAGNVYITNLQMTDPRGNTILSDGQFSRGTNMATYSAGASYGSYSLVPLDSVTVAPTNAPTNSPTPNPTNSPTPNPTSSPTPNPTRDQ
jgi:hypothetical protein